jgi:hypothetical protein
MRDGGSRGEQALVLVGALAVTAGILYLRKTRAAAAHVPAPVRVSAPVEPPAAPTERAAQLPPVEPADASSSPRRRRRVFVSSLVLALLAAGAYAAVTGLPGTDGRQRPVFAAVASSVAATSTEAMTQPTRTTASASPTTGFVPARTFVWATKSGDAGYRVVLSLDGRTVLVRRTSAARLRLPSSFVFRPGRYRWTVFALPATRGKAPRTDSSFELTPRAAAAANSEK